MAENELVSAVVGQHECIVQLHQVEPTGHRTRLNWKKHDGRTKLEADSKRTAVKQELGMEYTSPQGEPVVEPDPDRTWEVEFIVKTEDEVGTIMVKQESGVEMTVLHLEAAPNLSPALAQICRDQHSSCSFTGRSSPTSACALLAQPIRQTHMVDGYCKEGSGVPSYANFVLDEKETGDTCQKREEYNCFSNHNTSMDIQRDRRCRDCFKFKVECECNIRMSRIKADADIVGEEHEYNNRKYSKKRKSNFIYDIITNTGTKRYKCKQCEYIASRVDHLKLHIRTHTGVRPYKCEQCEYSASRIDHLKVHMRIHTGIKPFKCEQCEYSSCRMNNLRKHIRTHTGEKPYKCELCEYSASEHGHLKNHIRTHTGVKPYKCGQCEYSASRVYHLKIHMRTHTGEKPYGCERCDYSASRLAHLKKHIRVHTGEKPYNCEQCQYSASDPGHLRRHIRSHTGEKPFKCDQCEYSASRPEHLKMHMCTHTGEKLYKCDQCDYSSSRRCNIIRHMFKRHENTK